jgi:hypothetical protein
LLLSFFFKKKERKKKERGEVKIIAYIFLAKRKTK